MSKHSRIHRRRARPAAARPALEALEDRCVLSPSTYAQLVPFPNGSVSGTAVAVQSDGKAVVAGTFTPGGGTVHDIALARLNADGSPDTGFGSGGRVTLDFGLTGSNQQAAAVAVQADGRILVGGSVATNGSGAWEFALARFTAAGGLDVSFGAGGKETFAFGGDDFLTGLALQPADGKIVLAGHSDQPSTAVFAAARLNPDGTLDASFAAGGKQTIDFGAFNVANAVMLQPDGKILLVGSTGSRGTPGDVAVARLTPAGLLDGSFGNGGKAVINAAAPNPVFWGDNSEGLSVAVQPDGKILVGGDGIPQSNNVSHVTVALLSRLNANGSQDTTFATGGTAFVFFNAPTGNHTLSTNSRATGVAVDAGSRIVATGTVTITDAFAGPSGPFFAYTYFRADGTLLSHDPLTSSGTVLIGAGGTAQASAMALAPAGTMVLAGATTPQNGATSLAVARVALPPPPKTTTAATFDPTTGTWYLRNSNTPGAPDVPPFAYGAAGWTPVVGDWDGNGTATVGVFDPATATWYLKNSNTPGAPDIAPFRFGGSGWIPVVGDWHGTGHTGIGVVDPATNTWYLRDTASAGAPDIAPFQYGVPGTIPVAGDWDAQGRFAPGVFDPGTGKWYLASQSFVNSFAYGLGTDKPVVGDWDGDGIWTVGVYDPRGNGAWLLRNSNSPGAPDIAPFAYGAPTWTPLSGYYRAAPQELRAAGGEGPGAAALGAGDLTATVAAALGRLQQAGVSPAVRSRLSGVTALLAPLAPGQLGESLLAQGQIVLSPDGAGHGWFVDPTPSQDEEFTNGVAWPGSPAADRQDLLTAVLHELGHFAGLADDSGSVLMDELLPTGTRRTDALVAVFAGLSS
jgi:uncharacterized delta-60 repeat protein